MTDQDRAEFLARNTAASKALRRAILSSLALTVLVLLLAWITAFAIKRSGIVAESILVALRITSVGLLAWAVLGRLGWEIQTIKGRTIPEQVNRFWWRALYLIGLYFGLILIMVGALPEKMDGLGPPSLPRPFSIDVSTTASVATMLVTIIGVGLFVFFEWYRRPRLWARPSDDGAVDE